jgi:hypothetical protein
VLVQRRISTSSTVRMLLDTEKWLVGISLLAVHFITFLQFFDLAESTQPYASGSSRHMLGRFKNSCSYYCLTTPASSIMQTIYDEQLYIPTSTDYTATWARTMIEEVGALAVSKGNNQGR